MTIPVYLEVGQKRTFAGALEWPGWCRGGRNEAQALDMLLQYARRYAQALEGRRERFVVPGESSDFRIVERLQGGSGTDFGAPGAVPAHDARPMPRAELIRAEGILQACWRTFDAACRNAKRKTLRTGPRGGGRTLERIMTHVREANEAYLARVGWRQEREIGAPTTAEPGALRKAILEAMTASAHGALPATGPRGGKRWPPRYFVRRVAWHVLDHSWEIEDRLS